MPAENNDQRKRAHLVTAADADEKLSQRFHGTDDAVNEDEVVPQPADGIPLAEEEVAEDTSDEVTKSEMVTGAGHI